VLEQLETGIQRLNDTSEAFNLSLRFLLHEESERWMVQVVDLMDDKVIREIPRNMSSMWWPRSRSHRGFAGRAPLAERCLVQTGAKATVWV